MDLSNVVDSLRHERAVLASRLKQLEYAEQILTTLSGNKPAVKRTVSAASRAKMSRAQRESWARRRKVVPIGSAQKSYWARMTPAQRSAEMNRRMRKWSPTAKKMWAHKKVA